nr:CAP domain-containing protein [uncultured Desulfobulbus sp.]
MRILKLSILVSCFFFVCPILASCRSLSSHGLPPYETTLFNQINTYRKFVDLPPLRINKHLTRLARRHSFSMFRQKRLSHANFKTRFRQSGSRSCVENVGHNHSAPLKQFDAWRTSQGHDENMLNPEIRSVGLAKVGSFVTFFACH